MKFYLSIILLFISFSVSARFYDNFSDGDFTSNPQWFLSDMNADVVRSNGSFSILLSPSGSSNEGVKSGSFITANTDMDNTWWGCRIGFTSGNSSSVRFYVASLLPSLCKCFSYYVEFNAYSRSISFVYGTRNEDLLLMRSADNVIPAGSSEIVCKVMHSGIDWIISCSSVDGIVIWESKVSHSSNFYSTFSGFMVTGSESEFFSTMVYEANCGDKPDQEAMTSFGDIVFTEVMSKPSPSVGLPEVEWIEIFNNSEKVVNLENYKLISKSKIGTLSGYILEPGDYVVLCSYNAMLEMLDFTQNIVVVQSMPALVNDGGMLKLKNSYNHTVAFIEYDKKFYGYEDFKYDGGWSLEKKDANYPIDDVSNWGASIDPRGGTPGYENSIKGIVEDFATPRIISFGIPDPKSVQFRFSKPMLASNDDFNNSISVSGNKAYRFEFLEPKHDVLNIYFSEELDSTASVDICFYDMSCVSGIPMNDTTISISLPRLAAYMDVVFNEIMPYVSDERSKFIELYNNSDLFVDLSKFLLCNRSEDGRIINSERISDVSLILPPHLFCVVAADSSLLACELGINYESLYIEGQLPSMTSSGNTLVLCDRGGEIIDDLSWSVDWHHPSIRDTHNISLERVDPIVSTNESVNWQSASQSVGFNTAGWQNSQVISGDDTSDDKVFFWLENSNFSPDNDGVDDLLKISYSLPCSGYEFTADVYTRDGSFVGRIADNEILSSDGEWLWDGSNKSGSIVEIGLYIIVIEAYHPSEKIIKKKLIAIKGW